VKYRKKPVVIDAVQWMGDKKSWDGIIAMGLDKWKPGPMGSNSFYIVTLEGDMVASCGDFIIKGVNGEFYPCKPEIFDKTYDAIEAAQAGEES